MDAKDLKICVVGLGYVGMPMAVAFAEKGVKVIGFDVCKPKIEAYLNGQDPTCEVGSERLVKTLKWQSLLDVRS